MSSRTLISGYIGTELVSFVLLLAYNNVICSTRFSQRDSFGKSLKTMLKNYFKIAWRNLVKGKLYSIINIIGLAVGIACCLLIGLYIYQELRYDTFHKKANQIYRVNYSSNSSSGIYKTAKTPKPLAPLLEESFPEVKHAIRLQEEAGVVRIQNQLFKETFLVAEDGFLEMFSFKLLKGNPATVFSEREEILLSQGMADKLFGSQNPMGKSLELRIEGNYYQATVGGILKDGPEYSSIKYGLVIPLGFWKKAAPSYSRGNNWGGLRPSTYVLLGKQNDAKDLEQKLDIELSRKLENYNQARLYRFQPLTEIHLDNSVRGGLEPTANVQFIYISAVISALILIIACINFMSISIGHSARRAREVGMRKVMGAQRLQVMKQFWGETLMIVLAALVLGLLLTELVLPYFSSLIGTSLVVDWMANPTLPAMVLGVVVVTGLFAGSYPALYLSKFKPSQVFRNRINVEGKHLLIRSLSGIQFALAITLIIGTLFMNQQMDLLLNKSLGYDKEFVIQLEVPFEEGVDIVNNLKTALSSETSVELVSGAWETIGTDRVDFQAMEITSGDEQINGYTYGGGPELAKVLDLNLVKGRLIDKDADVKNKKELLVNQKLVESFGWDDPIGKKLSRIFTFENAEIVGVVEDFHFQSLHHSVGPLAIHTMDYYTSAYVRMSGGRVQDALANVETAWNEVAPGLPFDYTFLDETIEQQYRADNRWASIVQFASVIAIFLACMGLFGLAALATTKRIKEISIRKVLGATAAGITALLSKDFLKPVAVALLVAIPLSYLLMQQWLQSFATKIEMGIPTYAVAIILTVTLALLTISWQSIRAALANPVDSLRSE